VGTEVQSESAALPKKRKRKRRPVKKGPGKLTPKKRQEVCSVLSAGESIAAAADKVGIRRQSLWAARKRDKNFEAAWDDAIEHGTDLLEDEAKRRAVAGTLEPVFYKGKAVGAIRKYSDTLLIFLLKARRPAKFRDNAPMTEGEANHIADLFRAVRGGKSSGSDGDSEGGG
jgi:hypothetical protein